MNSFDLPLQPGITLQDVYSDRLFTVPGLSHPVRLIRPEGACRSKLLLMGEAGGENEQKDLLPFRPYAASGSLLERALREEGFDRSHVLITNTVFWQPRNNRLVNTPYEYDARSFCRQANVELIQRHQPLCILALGRTAFEELTGLSEINVINGRGMIYRSLPLYGSIPVVLTYHPSFIHRGSGKGREEHNEGAKTGKAQGGMSLFGVFKRDLRLAFQVARSGVPAIEPLEGILEPSDAQWSEAMTECERNPSAYISYDFETAYSLVLAGDEDEYTEEELREITQFQITVGTPEFRYRSYIAQWSPMVEEWCKRFMALPNPKLDVNGRFFDRRLLNTIGATLNGKFVDLQSLWAHLQPDLPRNLQFISSFFSPQYGAWKHLIHSDIGEYGKHDSILPLMAMEGILAVMKRLKHPQGIPLDQSYWTFTNSVESLCLDSYTRRGIPVNREKQIILGRQLDLEVEEEKKKMSILVPESLFPTKQKEGLKGHPPEWLKQHRLLIDSVKNEIRGRKRNKLPFEDAVKRLKELEEQKKVGPEGDRWALDEERVYVKRNGKWGLLNEFNPNSTEQMKSWIRYMRDEEIKILKSQYGESIPKTRLNALRWAVPVEKDEYGQPKETTGKDHLRKLNKRVGGHPVLLGALRIREITKLKGTYVGGEERAVGWTPGPDGLVHPEYSTYTGTWQFSSKSPNALNYPKHNKAWMDKVRGIIEVPSDRCIIEADYKSFHALTTGYEAGDEQYMRMARLDMHSFFALTQLLKLYDPNELFKETDSNLKLLFKSFRKNNERKWHGKTFEEIRSSEAKATGLGVGFGMQPNTLYEKNEDSFRSLDHAREVHRSYLELWWRVRKFHQDITQLADRQGYLISKHGGIRWFPCVYHKRPVKPGEWIRPGTMVRSTQWGDWIYTPGDDHEASIAYLPANDAFGMIRQALLSLEQQEWGERFWIAIPLHDAIICFPRWEDRDLCLEVLKKEMERPSDVLLLPDGSGLWCEAEFSCSKRGGNWGEMEEIKL